MPDPDFRELGATSMTYGILGRLAVQEYNPDLTPPNGYRIYDRMRWSDPKLAGVLNAMDLPLLHANWQIHSAHPGDPRADQIKEFVSHCLFQNMDRTWRETLHEILTYEAYGMSCFERCWKYEDGNIRIKRLGWLPPKTIIEIWVRDRMCYAVKQMTLEKGYVEIPGYKLLWFVNQKEGDNYRGVPMLRSMYKPWYNKERAEILLLILAERMGGFLKFQVPVGATQQDIDQANSIGANFSANEQMYIMLPPNWEAVIEAASGYTLKDLLDFINYCNEEMSNAVVAEVLDLGRTQTGSRALGRTLGDMFMDSIQARATYICEVFNNHSSGIIPELCRYNFSDWAENMPRLVVGRVNRIDFKAFGIAMKNLEQAGMTFGPNTWRWLRQEAELPAEELLDTYNTPQTTAPTNLVGDFSYDPPTDGDYEPTHDEIDPQPEG